MADRWFGGNLSRQRLGRRRLLQAGSVAVAGTAAATVIDCSRKQSQPSSSAGAGAQPKRGGIITYGGGNAGSNDLGGRGFDPMTITQFAAKSLTLFYERMVAYNLRTWEAEPELAEKWEQPSQTEYVFTIRQNVKWQNKPPVSGRLMTADDVVYSLERARTNDPRFTSRSLLSLVDKIESPDKNTVRVTTKSPDAGTLKKLAVDNLAVMAKEVVDKNPKLTTADAAVGTGAFIMKTEEDNVGAEYVPNPDYWKPGLPYLNGLRTKYFADLGTAYAAYLAGQLDATLLSGSDSDRYIASKGSGYTPNWYADDTCKIVYPNAKKKPLDDPRVWRALRLLMDHDEFVNTWAKTTWGKGAYSSIFPTALQDWDLTQDEYKQQLEYKQPKDDAIKEGLSLLGAAGYSKDNPIKFVLDTGTTDGAQPGTELLQAQWKRLGQGFIDTQIVVHQGGEVDTIRANGTFSYYFSAQSVGMVEPDLWLTVVYRSDGSSNFMRYNDPNLDAMIDKQRTIFDEQQRKALVKQIVLYCLDHVPSVIPANRYFLQALQPRVQNHAPEYYLNGRQYQSVWLSS